MSKFNFMLALAMLFLGSCVKDVIELKAKIEDFDGVIWSPTVAFPLVNASLSVEDIFKNTSSQYVLVNNDKSIVLTYNGTIFSASAPEVFALSNQIFNHSVVLSPSQLATINSVGEFEINRDFTLPFSLLSNTEIDSFYLRGGDFGLSINSDLNARTTFSYQIVKARLSDLPFDQELVLNGVGSTSKINNLNNSFFDFTQGTTPHSQLILKTKIKVQKVDIAPIVGSKIDIDVSMKDLKYRRIHFYTTQLDLNKGNDTINIDFYKSSEGGKFSLFDPQVTLSFHNSFGVPIAASLNKFEGINSQNNKLALSGSSVNAPLPIPYPIQGEYNVIKSDSILINNQTSNISSYLDNRPYKNVYSFNVSTNPTPGTRFWFTDKSVVRFDASVKIPLHGTAKDFIFERELPFDLSIEDVEEISEILLRLHTNNGFPASLAVQAYFVDSVTNTTLDSLMTNDLEILPAASVNSQGRTISSVPKTIDFTINKQRISALNKANKIKFKVFFHTLKNTDGSQNYVKFYSDYTLGLKLGVQAKALIVK